MKTFKAFEIIYTYHESLIKGLKPSIQKLQVLANNEMDATTKLLPHCKVLEIRPLS